jgi:hypothetical protein
MYDFTRTDLSMAQGLRQWDYHKYKQLREWMDGWMDGWMVSQERESSVNELGDKWVKTCLKHTRKKVKMERETWS